MRAGAGRGGGVAVARVLSRGVNEGEETLVVLLLFIGVFDTRHSQQLGSDGDDELIIIYGKKEN